MKIVLTEDYEMYPGHTIKEGCELTVSDAVGNRMVTDEGVAEIPQQVSADAKKKVLADKHSEAHEDEETEEITQTDNEEEQNG